jgi:hypothetical protein
LGGIKWTQRRRKQGHRILSHEKRRGQTRETPTRSADSKTANRFHIYFISSSKEEYKMAVTMVKPKAKVIDKVVASQIVSPETVDEYASLKAKLDKKNEKIAPLANAVSSLEKAILNAVDEVVDASVAFTLPGYDHELKLGPKGKRASITNMELAVDMLGQELFLKLAKITMEDLKAYLTPDQLAQVIKSEYTTKRRVKIEAL